MKRMVPLVLALALVVAACGGSDDEGVATLEDENRQLEQDVTDAAGTADDEQALLAFSACMRDNGVESFPDPVLNADGSVDFGQDSQPFAEVEPEVAEAAVNTCIDELQGVSFAPGGTDFDLNEIQDAFVEFAECMRENGVDFDDPDLASAFSDGQIRNPFGDLDITDPDVAAAVEVCQEVFVGVGPGLGG